MHKANSLQKSLPVNVLRKVYQFSFTQKSCNCLGVILEALQDESTNETLSLPYQNPCISVFTPSCMWCTEVSSLKGFLLDQRLMKGLLRKLFDNSMFANIILTS